MGRWCARQQWWAEASAKEGQGGLGGSREFSPSWFVGNFDGAAAPLASEPEPGRHQGCICAVIECPRNSVAAQGEALGPVSYDAAREVPLATATRRSTCGPGSSYPRSISEPGEMTASDLAGWERANWRPAPFAGARSGNVLPSTFPDLPG